MKEERRPAEEEEDMDDTEAMAKMLDASWGQLQVWGQAQVASPSSRPACRTAANTLQGCLFTHVDRPSLLQTFKTAHRSQVPHCTTCLPRDLPPANEAASSLFAIRYALFANRCRCYKT